MRQLTEVQPDSAPMHDWLALAEVADEIRASVSHVKTLLGQRGGPVEIPYFKHGKRTYVKRSELLRKSSFRHSRPVLTILCSTSANMFRL